MSGECHLVWYTPDISLWYNERKQWAVPKVYQIKLSACRAYFIWYTFDSANARTARKCNAFLSEHCECLLQFRKFEERRNCNYYMNAWLQRIFFFFLRIWTARRTQWTHIPYFYYHLNSEIISVSLGCPMDAPYFLPSVSNKDYKSK